jgi:phage/plasmid-like protein (TIGR03299 family)
MAYAGEVPWHGLGNPLARNQSIDTWAHQAGMDWTINETEVCFIAGSERRSIKAFPSQKVLYRSDNKLPLSVVSERYHTVQPREILEFYRDLTELGGFELETAGVLKEGRKFWALAKTGQAANIKGNDLVQGYLLLATACDGTLATTAQFTSIRVVCANTLHVALKDGSSAVKVPHSTQFDAQAVKKQLGIAISSWDTFMAQVKALADCKVSDAQAKAFLCSIVGVPAIQSQPLPLPVTGERTIKAIHELYAGDGKGSNLLSAKGTAWGLVNSVTEFVDHHRRARSADHRLDAAWFGQGAAIKEKAWEEALSLVA